MRIGIIGGGAWGSALGHIFSKKHEVFIYDHNKEKLKLIERGLYPAFPSLRISSSLKPIFDLKELLQVSEVLVLSVPVKEIRKVLENFQSLGLTKPIFINTAKGLELNTFKRVSEIVLEKFPNAKYFVLSGPSFAKEVVEEKPTAVVLSGSDKALGKKLQLELNINHFRIYWNDDVIGVELGGALKNVIAIAVGIAEGLNLGLNSCSALITRGLKEMVYIGTNLGAKKETFLD
jgi:glycerol-3-phosphate dehydrogenase (NAD(P)+)